MSLFAAALSRVLEKTRIENFLSILEGMDASQKRDLLNKMSTRCSELGLRTKEMIEAISTDSSEERINSHLLATSYALACMEKLAHLHEATREFYHPAVDSAVLSCVLEATDFRRS